MLAMAMAIVWWVGGEGEDQPPPTAAAAVVLDPPAPLPKAHGLPSSTRIGEAPAELVARRLTIPVLGVTSDELSPQFFDARGERGHQAIDIMAPSGRSVVAVEDGVIAKLHVSEAGGLTIYQFDPGQKYAYYYAHLQRYAAGLAEGQSVRRGQVIAFVGMTGNATTPHLHFAISRLGPDKKWSQGQPLDPYPALTAELPRPPPP